MGTSVKKAREKVSDKVVPVTVFCRTSHVEEMKKRWKFERLKIEGKLKD